MFQKIFSTYLTSFSGVCSNEMSRENVQLEGLPVEQYQNGPPQKTELRKEGYQIRREAKELKLLAERQD